MLMVGIAEELHNKGRDFASTLLEKGRLMSRSAAQ